MNERITIDWRKDRYALDKLMTTDHVIRVHEDGTVSEPESVWAPEVTDNTDLASDGPEDIQVDSMAGGPAWSVLHGFTGQYAYHGPVMHDSEFVGGHLARHILDNPGLYAVVAVSGADGVDVGWAVAFAECD